MTSPDPTLTLDDANRIFEVVGIEITQHYSQAFYEAFYREQRYQARTLIALCQRLVLALQVTH